MASSPTFPCPQCGARAFQRHPVETDGHALAHLSLCTACGENYLAVVHHDPGRARVETWDFGLDADPPLRRVYGYAGGSAASVSEPRVVTRLFFVGDRTVPEPTWRAALAVRRALPSRVAPRASVRPSDAWLAQCQAWWRRQARRGRLSHVSASLLAAPSLAARRDGPRSTDLP